MFCDRCEELLNAQFDGAISNEDKAALDEHVSKCARCRAEKTLYETALSTLEDLSDEVDVPSAEIMQAVMARVESMPAHRRQAPVEVRVARWTWAAVAAVALIGVMGSMVGIEQEVPVTEPAIVQAAVQEREEAAVGTAAVQKEAAVRTAAVGKLQVDIGVVLIKGQGQSDEWTLVDDSVNLSIGDRISTKKAARAWVTLHKRGRLTLQASTDVQILDQGLRLRQGATWIKIVKRGDKFRVETPNAVASVRGTVYTVAVSENLPPATHVNVFEGTVAVAPVGKLEEETLVRADQSVDVVGTLADEVQPIARDEYLAFGAEIPAHLQTVTAVDDVVSETDEQPAASAVEEREPPLVLEPLPETISGPSSSAAPRGGF